MTTWVCLLLACGATWPCWGHASAEGPFSSSTQSPTPEAVVPFEYFRGHIYLRPSLEGAGPRTFLLDTGFITEGRMVLISPSAADGLRDRHGAPLDIEVLGRDTLHGKKAHDVNVWLTENMVVHSAAEVLDLSPLQAALHHPLDGIIGYAFLRDHVAEINYADHTLVLYAKGHYRYQGHGFQLPMDKDRPVVHARVVLPDGKEALSQLMVDTGSDSVLLFYRHFIDRYTRSLAGASLQQTTYVGLGGLYTCDVVRLIKVQLGNDLAGDSLVIDRPYVGLARMNAGVSAKSRLDGDLGDRVLEKSNVIFDPSRRRLIFEPVRLKDAMKN